MFARFDENPAMTLRVIKETKRYGRTNGRTDNVKTVYPLQTKFAGGIKKILPVTPKSTQWAVPYLLYQYLWENPSEYKGLKNIHIVKYLSL